MVARFLIFLGCLVANIGTELSYAWSLPPSADPEPDRVFGVTIHHGTHVYVTQRELDRLRFVEGPLFAVMLADFAVIGL
jgi:hypothetical protein